MGDGRPEAACERSGRPPAERDTGRRVRHSIPEEERRIWAAVRAASPSFKWPFFCFFFAATPADSPHSTEPRCQNEKKKFSANCARINQRLPLEEAVVSVKRQFVFWMGGKKEGDWFPPKFVSAEIALV